MIVPGSAHALLLSTTGGYDVPYSLRFRSANTAYIRRIIGASSTSTTIATWSFWIKRGAFGAGRQLIVYNGNAAGTGNTIQLEFTSGSAILAYFNGAGTTGFTTNAVFRDPSAWYHVVLAYDSTQATDSDRSKLYVNGTQITSFASVTYPTLNQAFNAGSGDYQQMMGLGATLNTDGYMAEVNFIDGQALTPSSFGQTDSATGVWVPKKYSGTYGTNGFYLKFADASAATAAAIGKDSSGNGNNWTPSGISVTSGVTFDQMLDTPTLNYCVLNPVDPTGSTLSNANLSASIPFATNSIVKGSISPSTGKWYWEVTVTSGGVGTVGILVAGTAESYYPGYTSADGISYRSGGSVRRTGSTIQTYTTFTTNDVIGIALDLDNGKVFFSKNGTWQGSSDPAAGTNPAASTNISDKIWNAANGNDSAAAAGHAFNFGQRAFAYTPPSGFKALNTANLPTPSIKKGSLYMDATLRTGTGATASVSSLGFQPDLVWIKSRSAATSHNLFDTSRGVQKGLLPDSTSGEYTDANTLTAFLANGYSLGSDSTPRGVNVNAATYVDWTWKEGVLPGVDIVEYAGNNTSNRNISHSLGVAPSFAIIRNKGATGSWFVWHRDLTSAAHYLRLENENAQSNSTTPFGTGNWSSTQFMVTNNATYNLNANSNNYIAYLFAEVEGFSKFGSYVGNASTDGPFAFCNMRPRFIMLKNASTAITNWAMKDTARSTSNVAGVTLRANAATAEATGEDFDILSNGFKVRNTGSTYNSSGGTIIFAAFAENPFKYARAR